MLRCWNFQFCLFCEILQFLDAAVQPVDCLLNDAEIHKSVLHWYWVSACVDDTVPEHLRGLHVKTCFRCAGTLKCFSTCGCADDASVEDCHQIVVWEQWRSQLLYCRAMLVQKGLAMYFGHVPIMVLHAQIIGAVYEERLQEPDVVGIAIDDVCCDEILHVGGESVFSQFGECLLLVFNGFLHPRVVVSHESFVPCPERKVASFALIHEMSGKGQVPLFILPGGVSQICFLFNWYSSSVMFPFFR